MGFSIDYYGSFYLSPPLTPQQVTDINSVYDIEFERSTPRGGGCPWICNDSGDELEYCGLEKCYNAFEWLEYLGEKCFVPWNISISGIIDVKCFEYEYRGKIWVIDGKFVEIGNDEQEAAFKIQRCWMNYKRNRAARIIQKACENWLYKPMCNDGTIGIVPRLMVEKCKS